MKKILIFIMCFLILPLSVDAANRIHSIDIDVNLDKDGTAYITEIWDVDGSDGTEWYKVINNLGNSELSNFKVSMDGKNLTYKDWDVDESLSQKKGYYGINYTSDGLELCFGKYDYKRHKFTLTYTLSNFIFNTEDSQIIYFNFIDKLSNVNFDDFSVSISSFYSFPDTLDVWGYGYKGYAYVKDGKIEMSNEGNMDDNYVVLLAKFPLETFTISNYYPSYYNFDDVYNRAEEGTFEYDYDESWLSIIFSFLSSFLVFILPILICVIAVYNSNYGYINNKKIVKKDVPFFRDIPCNKDIYYANILIKLNNFGYKSGNILGAIILKWIRDDKVSFRNEQTGIFNKDTSVIDLNKDVTFDNETETKLFNMMRAASGDGLLLAKEFSSWCNKNYSSFLNVFTKLENDTIKSLKNSGSIRNRMNRKECKFKNVMDDNMYNDSIQLYGLKKYLEEFSRMNTKEVMDVKLWDEYLMFAYLFGIADKVAKQLKDMYPEVAVQMQENHLDFDTIYFISRISSKGVSSADSARRAAESYSSGGGGFSSGGGGGGSFGGGGGGSR